MNYSMLMARLDPQELLDTKHNDGLRHIGSWSVLRGEITGNVKGRPQLETGRIGRWRSTSLTRVLAEVLRETVAHESTLLLNVVPIVSYNTMNS
jgi:hypothetical protein